MISSICTIISNIFFSLSCVKAMEIDSWKPGLSLFDTGKYLKNLVTSLGVSGFHHTQEKQNLFIH